MATLTLAQLRVDLDQFEAAIGTVQAQYDIINTNCQVISELMRGVEPGWISPAGQTFDTLTRACVAQLTTLTDLLQEMGSRMQTTYQQYLDVEHANYNNYQSRGAAGPSGHGHPGHGHPGHGNPAARAASEPPGGTGQTALLRSVAPAAQPAELLRTASIAAGQG